MRSAARVVGDWSTKEKLIEEIMTIVNSGPPADARISHSTLHSVLRARGLLPTCELDSAEYAAMARTFFFCLLWRVRSKEVKDERNAQRATHDCGCDI